MSEVKVYKIDWQDGDYNSFVGEVVSFRDYSSVLAELVECKKKLEECLYIHRNNKDKAEIL